MCLSPNCPWAEFHILSFHQRLQGSNAGCQIWNGLKWFEPIDAGYSNFNIAFVTLFRALMGDLDFDAMEEQAGRIIVGSLIPESSRCFWIDNFDGSC